MVDFRLACAMAAYLLALTATGAAQPALAPELTFETIDGQPADEPRLRRIDRDRLRSIVDLAGLAAPGPPVRVVLAREESELARATPSWIAGFAHSASDTVVLFPSRSPRYPHDSLEAVLRHELAHVLIARAAGGHSVPRWFNEGLAMVAERAWHFEDRRQLAWALFAGDPVRMDDVNTWFEGGSSSAGRGYAVASAFVRHIIERHGPDAPGRILARVADGARFDSAFEQATGRSIVDAERTFHAEVTSWTRWLPLLTSPLVVWMMVTLLAIYAIYVARRRRAERRRKWTEEEAGDATPHTVQ